MFVRSSYDQEPPAGNAGELRIRVGIPNPATKALLVWEERINRKDREMKKLKIARSEMRKVAEEHKALGKEVKIWEAENLTTGRILWVRKGRQILIMRYPPARRAAATRRPINAPDAGTLMSASGP